jgi:hypothetical protein
LRNLVANTYGSSSEAYDDFGFTAPRKGKPSAKTKAAAVDQVLATREARHTMGKKQRLAIRGVVTPQDGAAAATAPSSTSATASVAPPSTTGVANGGTSMGSGGSTK